VLIHLQQKGHLRVTLKLEDQSEENLAHALANWICFLIVSFIKAGRRIKGKVGFALYQGWQVRVQVRAGAGCGTSSSARS